jgi:hypothetical protein
MRTPNANCVKCGKGVYRRPAELERGKIPYCSKICYHGTLDNVEYRCPICRKLFRPRDRVQKYCDKICAGISRRGLIYEKNKSKNKSLEHLSSLKGKFEFEHCMVEGCLYNATFDIHRFVPGNQGGKYEIGNMFAICPNHHAEVTRKLIVLQKINDYTLKALEPDGQVADCKPA